MSCHCPFMRLSLVMLTACILTPALVLGGCGIKNKYTKKQMFKLCATEDDPADQRNRPVGVPLFVKHLEISPEFSGAGFVYRVDQNRFIQDYYNTYMTPPAPMIRDAMFEALVNSPGFSPAPKTPLPNETFLLWGKITALYCDRRKASEPSAVVRMALNLDRLHKNDSTPVLAKSYCAQLPLPPGNAPDPQAYIQALNRGLADIVHRILSDFRMLATPANAEERSDKTP